METACQGSCFNITCTRKGQSESPEVRSEASRGTGSMADQTARVNPFGLIHHPREPRRRLRSSNPPWGNDFGNGTYGGGDFQ